MSGVPRNKRADRVTSPPPLNNQLYRTKCRANYSVKLLLHCEKANVITIFSLTLLLFNVTIKLGSLRTHLEAVGVSRLIPAH